jgi:transaldolase
MSSNLTSPFQVKIFADGADVASIMELSRHPYIQGFTTNPTLMRKAGIRDYEAFGRELTSLIPDRPFSFEVLSDDFDEMERQALIIASWGSNVYVKIPITNTRGESSAALVARLAGQGVKVNVTALMTLAQVDAVVGSLRQGPPSYISIFAGRIADAGVDPLPILVAALDRIREHRQIELIWASPRELFNIVQAGAIGCHVITVTHDLLKKLPLIGKDLTEYSLDTVKMFVDDARAAGFVLESRPALVPAR